MKAMRWTLCLLALSAGMMLLCVPVGFAAPKEDVPEPCLENATTQQQYATGYDFGGLAVDQAWLSIAKDCNQLPTFYANLKRIFDNLLLPPDPSISFTCRYSGIYNGGIEKLTSFWKTCAELCAMDGELVGQLIGQLYCNLSTALDGLVEAETTFCRPPSAWCTEIEQTTCDLTYYDYTVNYVDLLGFACKPYTEDPYDQPPPDLSDPLKDGVYGQFGFNGCTVQSP